VASTLTIPLATLPVGTLNFPATGGAAVPDADTSILLSIDRTVAGGLNSKTAATTIFIESWQSGDGGATWQSLAANTVVGGIFTKGGTQINTDHVGTGLNPGTGRLVRASVTVSGASVAVAGSLTTS